MNVETSDKIISALSGHYGHVNPDLIFSNIYELIISVVLSAQTTDRQVNSVTGKLFKKYPDFRSLAGASIADVENIVRPTGFYRNKAANIVALAAKVENDFGGMVPPDFKSLTSLPGVGRKTANVVLSVGFGIPAMPVDTHVMRLAFRLGYTDSADPLKAENALMKIVPDRLWKNVHLLLIRHGRDICKARNPVCGICPIYSLCESPDKTC